MKPEEQFRVYTDYRVLWRSLASHRANLWVQAQGLLCWSSPTSWYAMVSKQTWGQAGQEQDSLQNTGLRGNSPRRLSPNAICIQVSPNVFCFFVRAVPADCSEHTSAFDADTWGDTVLGMLLMSRENACVCNSSVCTPLWCDLGRFQVAQTFAGLQNHWL